MASYRGRLSLYIYQTSRKKDHLLAIPGDSTASFPTSMLKVPEQWDLISPSLNINTTGLHPPPRTWMVLDSLQKSHESIDRWPVPQLFKRQTSKKYTVLKIFPFNDQRSALQVTFTKSSLLLIDGSTLSDSLPETTRFKEKIDLLLLSDADSATATVCRSLFRPKFTVASGRGDLSMPSYSNLVLLTATSPQYLLFKITSDIRQIPLPTQFPKN